MANESANDIYVAPYAAAGWVETSAPDAAEVYVQNKSKFSIYVATGAAAPPELAHGWHLSPGAGLPVIVSGKLFVAVPGSMPAAVNISTTN